MTLLLGQRTHFHTQQFTLASCVIQYLEDRSKRIKTKLICSYIVSLRTV